MSSPRPPRRPRPPGPASVSLALAVLLPALLPAAATGQSAADVVDRALQRYEERMEGVENYTVVQEAMGNRTTTHFVRTTADGHTVFVPRGAEEGGGDRQVPHYTAMLNEMGKRATLQGTEPVDGRECHVLQLTDFSGDAFRQWNPGQGNWTPERLRLFIDTGELLVRKVVLEGTVARGEQGKQPVTVTARLRDYRNVDGVVHPFRTEIRTEGLGPSMTPEQRARMEKFLEKMEQLPPRQRKMMEERMGDKLEKMKQMMASGTLDVTATVEEIRVNEGPPEQ